MRNYSYRFPFHCVFKNMEHFYAYKLWQPPKNEQTQLMLQLLLRFFFIPEALLHINRKQKSNPKLNNIEF